jgi:RNAse (barnase) inhibitor barstar
MAKPVFEIDGARFTTLEGFYEEVSRILIPGHAWGHNLDAFNDILRGGFGIPVDGFRLVWKNHDVSREALGHIETARQLDMRLQRCHPSNRTRVAADLAAARDGHGATTFDWLVDIIKRHGKVELVLS